MSRIRGTKTKFEIGVFRQIRKRGIYFKTHYARVIGKPDIALPKSRKAVFLHSDFWHGWRLSSWEHILPSEFWKTKLKKNRARDRKVAAALRRSGWKVLTIWEHQLSNNEKEAIDKIAKFLKTANTREIKS
jgi:DNA mismatch endonuclease (patch repair protein)